jgi:hypothetical protein
MAILVIMLIAVPAGLASQLAWKHAGLEQQRMVKGL